MSWPRNTLYPQKWALLRRQRRSLGRYSSLADYGNGVSFRVIIVFHVLEKTVVAKGCKFSLYALLLESVIVTKFQATKAYSNLDLIKTKYSIIRLVCGGRGKFELTIVILLHVKKKIDIMMKVNFSISMHTQILNTICLQYKRIHKSVLIAQSVHFPGKISNYNFSKIRLHETFRTPLNWLNW
jgi:hypothetical protein